jgi:hypothetical protein
LHNTDKAIGFKHFVMDGEGWDDENSHVIRTPFAHAQWITAEQGIDDVRGSCNGITIRCRVPQVG